MVPYSREMFTRLEMRRELFCEFQEFQLVVMSTNPILFKYVSSLLLNWSRPLSHTIMASGQKVTRKRKYHARCPSHISAPCIPRISLLIIEFAYSSAGIPFSFPLYLICSIVLFIGKYIESSGAYSPWCRILLRTNPVTTSITSMFKGSNSYSST